ncbi:MAG TPA: nucleoside triphosphate pyrophosphatase [Sphingomicrobium sp.]|jgi:septum formation protein|nr:nucleoside triphosphate pyrophosphatase [Sphingomicrobium sp.]
MDLLLASTSPIRRTLLTNAGVPFRWEAPKVDEDRVKAHHRGSDSDLAVALAKTKALAVSARHPASLVIGSDSLVSVAGRRFSKPADRAEAAEHLQFFSGREMVLTSAAALLRGNDVQWQHASTATMQFRALTAEFIEAYLSAEWPEVAYCVGVFRLEARGVQLFNRIEGDHFTILGLPLLPLLAALRERGVMPT